MRQGVFTLAMTAPAAASYTTTNTQERGVDEPDFIKNDGSRIFLLQGQSLVILSAWPPTSLSIQSETAIEGSVVDGVAQTEIKGDASAVNEIDWENYLDNYSMASPMPEVWCWAALSHAFSSRSRISSGSRQRSKSIDANSLGLMSVSWIFWPV